LFKKHYLFFLLVTSPSPTQLTQSSTNLIKNKNSRAKLSQAGKSKSLPDLFFPKLLDEQELMEAIQEGDITNLKYILNRQRRVEINFVDENGLTPLHWASQTGNKEAVSLLLGIYGINVNQQDSNGKTPLHYAATLDFEDIVVLLIQHKDIDVTIKDFQQKTPKDLSNSKKIIGILNYAEKKQNLKNENSSGLLKITSNPVFGGGPQVETLSIIKVLRDREMTIQQLKKQLQTLQEKNAQLEKEFLKESVNWILEDDSEESDNANFY
jgi:ankyrin repeat protein